MPRIMRCFHIQNLMSDERVLTQKQRRMTLQNLGQFDGGETCSFEQRPLSEHGCIFEET